MNNDGLPEKYVSEIDAILREQLVPENGLKVSVLGPSGSGKTYEIESSLAGVGVKPTISTVDSLAKYTIKHGIPLSGYDNLSVISIKGNRSKSNAITNLIVSDLIGQSDKESIVGIVKNVYNVKNERDETVTEVREEKRAGVSKDYFFNLLSITGSNVIEFVVDATNPAKVNQIIENWLPMVEKAGKYEKAEISVYISKSRMPESVVNMDEITTGNYSSLEKLGLENLLSSIETKFKKKPMVFAGDMNCTVEVTEEEKDERGNLVPVTRLKEHQIDLYLIKAGNEKDSKIDYSYLSAPVKVLGHATKILPSLRYILVNNQTSEGMKSLASQIEEDFGFKFTGY